MKHLTYLIFLVITFNLVGCTATSLKPTELPQHPYAYNPHDSIALHYAQAMGIKNIVDYPKGKKVVMVKEEAVTPLEAGTSSAVTGSIISFALAKSLGFSTSDSASLAKDHIGEDFTEGALLKSHMPSHPFYSLAYYLPYELADSEESARKYVFNFFLQKFKNSGLKLEDIDDAYKYGGGHKYTDAYCEKLELDCLYVDGIPRPTVAYAPEKLGGYKAWVWSKASDNEPGLALYNILTFSQIFNFDDKTIAEVEKKLDDVFYDCIESDLPDWVVEYKSPNYEDSAMVRVKGKIYRFEKPTIN